MPEGVRVTLPALFISDLHLAEDHRETLTAFVDFLNGPARAAGSLFILGDLFEYWAGDDDIENAFNRDICAALRALSDQGVKLFYMTGNRDLLAGSGFASAAGVELLSDPTRVSLDGQHVLLSHGDALCTDDQAYQAYRTQVRDPAWQAGFLSQPLAARKAFIESLRKQSEVAKQEKAMTIMDVNAVAVDALLSAHGYPVLIHGHTHRPACHTWSVDGRECTRWVLADWHDHATWLAFDGTRFTANTMPPPVSE